MVGSLFKSITVKCEPLIVVMVGVMVVVVGLNVMIWCVPLHYHPSSAFNSTVSTVMLVDYIGTSGLFCQ